MHSLRIKCDIAEVVKRQTKIAADIRIKTPMFLVFRPQLHYSCIDAVHKQVTALSRKHPVINNEIYKHLKAR